ncbi:MAG TPA: malto-oligosyltrehalose trehalohydrolase [Trebonia sp.]|nr:malto-oligosyltrehalose trehalohydrolase [Trebonia sp.]
MTLFRLWAPGAARVDVQVAGTPHPMARVPGPESQAGWWAAEVDAPAVVDYAFVVDGTAPVPDPRSRRQPFGPAGASRTEPLSPAFPWTDSGTHGMTLHDAVIYELHVGTFTPEGTLDAAIGRLGHLVSLGVTAIEVMPVAAFPGQHGWGYDGIGLWAVHEPYGGPAALCRFVDACHASGLAVILDVVYNHFGPGNRLPDIGPYFTTTYATPWGPAINLDQPGSDEVRDFIIGNALRWLRDFHIDGLRLDAVHALEDRRAVHILEELSAAVGALSATTGRAYVLIAETDLNNPRLITARAAGGYGLDGQWNDDFHHAVHAAVTGERHGYYRDFGTMASLAKTMTGAYFHDGTWSSFRGRHHGRPVDRRSVLAYRFVCFLQDHDQVGNRATGDRITGSVSRDMLHVAAGLVLTAPFTPMLFMGEEWGAGTPFLYFTDHVDPYFASAVSRGRRAEFAAHGWAEADIPDPQDPETFRRSRLDWSQPERAPYAPTLAWYRRLIALRKAHSEITDPRLDQVRADYDEDARWLLVHRGNLRIAANLARPAEGGTAVRIPVGRASVLAASNQGVSVADGQVLLPPESLAVIDVSDPPKL